MSILLKIKKLNNGQKLLKLESKASQIIENAKEEENQKKKLYRY